MYRVRLKVLLTLAALVAAPFSWAESALKIKNDAPQTYTVVKGDTLWDISELYLDNPWLWPRLWQANSYINNPHLIYPGDKLNLIWRNGQPLLSLKTMVKLSPRVRLLDKQAVPVVSESLVLPYLESDRLLTLLSLQQVDRVLGSSNGKQFLTNEDVLYISGQQSQTQWGIYREVETFTREEQRVVALKQVAWGELSSADADMSSLRITQQVQEILVDDIALPVVESDKGELTTTFYPQPSPAESVAHILGTLEGSQYVGQNQVVVIDRGEQDNLTQGSMFELYKHGAAVSAKQSASKVVEKAVKDKLTMPNQRIGSLMVIRPYQHFSLALVTESLQPIGKDTLVQAPVVPDSAHQELNTQ